jgi:DNA polymerase-1
MSKSLWGQELDLSDAPAKGARLFVIDGNNLAYRAFYALPPELATSKGEPTNTLLGFANMLFRLVVDYRPEAVVVTWDRRPVQRLVEHAEYKAGRKPMPDVLRTQFPLLPDLVRAFGYPNVSVEGWEADDVMATLARIADDKGIRTVVVSTDRDAFQLVTPTVSLMMTPRGVADVLVYTPERVKERYGLEPAQIPDFIALKGDTSDNIPSVPGFGEKTAAELLMRHGSVEKLLEAADSLPKAKRAALLEQADQVRASKALATLRRDLDCPVDLETLLAGPVDRAGLLPFCERFEFKNIKNRMHLLDAPAR